MKHSLPQKYSALKTAEKAGIRVPKTLLIDSDTEKKTIEIFLEKFSPQQKFIVRSAVSGEDSINESFAGHFFSSEAIEKKYIYETIKKTMRENISRTQKYHLKKKVFCILQPFFTTKCGGVLMSRWKFFPHYFLGEITADGPQAAVEGKKNSFFLLHKKRENAIIPLPQQWEKHSQTLQKNIQKIEKTFSFVADVEWGITSENQCIVFQIRPITAPIEALFLAEKKENIPAGNWQKNPLAESLGVLSPLSFSLVETLFSKSRKLLQEYGIEAKKINFLWRAPNGEIFVEGTHEKIFWKNKGIFSLFFRNAKKNILREEIWKSAKRKNKRKPFSYKKIEQVFSWWLLSNLFVKEIHTKNNYTYELLEKNNTPFPKLEKKEWKEINSFLREWFFFELEKLKKEIQKKPESIFLNFKEWEKNKNMYSLLQKKEDEHIQDSIYDFSHLVLGEKTGGKMRKAAGKNVVMGNTYIVENPYIHTKKIPAGVVLVSPFFRNEWIEFLPYLSGVVLEQGGMLSHSAIVAREKNIPYFFHVENATQVYKNTKKIILDCQVNDISAI